MVSQKEKTLLERIKTEFVTSPQQKQPITERTKKLRDTLLATAPKICPERARLYTRSWENTEGKPLEIRRAKALEKILSEMTIFIRPGELIVGNHASDVRAAPLFPEFYTKFVLDELDGKPYRFDDRPGDRFLVSEETETELREIAKRWLGKTMTDYKYNLYPDEVWKAGYEIGAIDLTQHGECGGSGHYIPGYEKALEKGFNGVIKEAEEALSLLKLWEPDALGKKNFLEAAIITLKAGINFGKRFASLARETAAGEEDPKRKAELEQIAEHCEWVPANPPRTFREAMQMLWFFHLIIQIESNGHSVSYGRFDQYMYPFYQREIEAGKITTEEVVELIECLWIKTTEINKLRTWAATKVVFGYMLFQNLTLGGQTKDGHSAINDLSWLALEATANQKIIQPSVSVRYWDGIPDDFLLKCCDVINVHRGGQPAIYNDEVIIASQLAAGIALEDAYNYGINGCAEPTTGGNSKRQGVCILYNMLKVLELTLYNGKDPRTGIQLNPNPDNKDLTTFKSFDEFKAALKQQYQYFTRLGVIGLNCIEKAFAEMTPLPFVSSFMEDCIKNAKDMEWGGCRYNTATVIDIGMSNVGNSLAAIRKLVFEEKSLTGAQLLHALKTNFEDTTTTPTGSEIERMLLAVPKFGNDDDYVDFMVREALSYIAKDVPNYTSVTGGKCGNSITSVTINIPFGEICGATPDGRKAGKSTNEGCSPVQGSDTHGPTAVAKSVAKLQHVDFDNGTLLNQRVSPSLFKEKIGIHKLASLIRTYCELKGMHIQFNVVSSETLRDAQKHPEKHSDLMVRVAGYSALFTPLDPKVQEDIIARTEQQM